MVNRKRNPYRSECKLEDLIVDGNPTEFCWNFVTKLSNAIVSKYFSKYTSFFSREELTQLAICDSVDFAKKLYDLDAGGSIKNVRNVFFTRIRNTLSNFVFRSNRLVPTEDITIELSKKSEKPASAIIPDIHKDEFISVLGDLTESLDSVRGITAKTWLYFLESTPVSKYTINYTNNSLDDWISYSEVKNMKAPCDLINAYDTYSEDQVEVLSEKLDTLAGENYFNILYQLLGDKFLAFLDIFQDSEFKVPAATQVKKMLKNIAINDDYNDGVSIEDLANKNNLSPEAINKIIAFRNFKDTL